MSHITDVILTTAVEDPGISTIQTRFVLNGRPLMVNVAPRAGGPKHMTASVWLCAVNYLDDVDLIELIKKAPWKCPDAVSLFMRRDGEMAFKQVNIR